MKKVIVIGGGAAGMMAAISAASCGDKVILVEKNEKLGKKLFITGKGRCNITNACDTIDLFSQIISNPKFLYSAIYTFSNDSTIQFFNENGLRTKVERGNRVFPLSDKSSDVIKTLDKCLKEKDVDVLLNTKVIDILVKEKTVYAVKTNKQTIECDKVIVATGGQSYSSTGSNGDGYIFAKKLGHTVTDIRPGLTGLTSVDADIKDAMGLTLKNVSVDFKLKNSNKILYSGFGEVLLTHYGVSGPLVLSASSILGDKIKDGIEMHIDLKPALDKDQLDKRLLRDFEERMNNSIKNTLGKLLPKSIIPIFLDRLSIAEDKKTNAITKAERLSMIELIKKFKIDINGLRGLDEAIITRGGVSVKEIDPSTMESKIIKDLYFAGEIIDVDALTGGYNLQIAWSTGYLAGM